MKHFIDTGAGVVDEDYRGAVGVVLFNHGEADYHGGLLWVLFSAVSHLYLLQVAPRNVLCCVVSCPVRQGPRCHMFHHARKVHPDTRSCTVPAVKRGDRIAQLILERIVTPEVVEVDDLEATMRGAGGFGSTGVGSLGG